LFTLLGVWLVQRSNLKQLNLKLSHESNNEARGTLLDKLEELYSLISRWANDLILHHDVYRSVMRGDLSYNQALDIVIDRKPNVDAARMFTLAELYFPEAWDALKEMTDLRDQAFRIQEDFKRQYKVDGQPSHDHERRLTEVLKKLEEAIRKYQLQLSKYAKILTPHERVSK
jgi:hypothetical protein